jgi:hypothetical protein
VTAQQARAANLTAARRRDSHEKRQRVQDAVAALERAGVAITFAGVAKSARVSTWLVYADGVRQHVDAGRGRQAEYGLTDQPQPLPERMQASPAGLRTDLAIARQEIKALRDERDRLRDRLRLQLGAELDASTRAELVGRIAELDSRNRELLQAADTSKSENTTLQTRVGELEDDLAAARESLRRVIRAENSRR